MLNRIIAKFLPSNPKRAAIAAVGGVVAFVAIAAMVNSGCAQAFDDWLLRSLRQADNPELPLGPAWMTKVVRDISSLGSGTILTLVTAATGGALLLAGNKRTLLLLGGAVGGGVALAAALKELFDRARPAVVPHLEQVSSASFPSAHSMLATLVYLTCGVMAARDVESARLRRYLIGLAIAVSFLVGLSRVVLGVHFPTDVVSGWIAGLVWAILCWLLAASLGQGFPAPRARSL